MENFVSNIPEPDNTPEPSDWELWAAEMDQAMWPSSEPYSYGVVGLDNPEDGDSTAPRAMNYGTYLRDVALTRIAGVTGLGGNNSSIIFCGAGLDEKSNAEIVDGVVGSLQGPNPDFALPLPTKLFAELDEQCSSLVGRFKQSAITAMQIPHRAGVVEYAFNINGVPTVLTVGRMHASGRNCFTMSLRLAEETYGVIKAAEAVFEGIQQA